MLQVASHIAVLINIICCTRNAPTNTTSEATPKLMHSAGVALCNGTLVALHTSSGPK